MRKVKIELPGGQALYLGLPDGAKFVSEDRETPSAPTPQNPQPKKEGKQQTLYNELKEYCNGDAFEMEKVMRTVSEWQNKSKTVAEIPTLTDGRAGATLRNLRELKKKGKRPTEQPKQEPDNDIPF